MSQILWSEVNSGFDSRLERREIRNMSRSNSHEAQIEPQAKHHFRVFSLSRLWREIEKGRTLPPAICIGGRYYLESGHPLLADANGVIDLPSALDTATNGDLVEIELLSKNLILTGQEASLKRGRLTSIQSSRVVYKNQSKELTVVEGLFFRRWAQFIEGVRHWFTDQGLVEVRTPTLVTNPGMEPELEPFATHFRQGSKEQKLFLATSPELHLKQLLVRGLTDIFELKTVFRNEELTRYHEPEFLMLEWYRAFADLTNIESDLRELLAYLGHTLDRKIPKIERYTVAQLWAQQTGHVLTPQTTRDELLALAKNLHLAPNESFGFNDLFHLIWVSLVEPHLPRGPFFLVDYPPSQAALAVVGPEGWAQRFEFYWNGLEIANAFQELNNPDEQRSRFMRDQKQRVEYGRTPLGIDENFMSALIAGLPPSGGIALGLDRLYMALFELENISGTRAFGMAHNLKS